MAAGEAAGRVSCACRSVLRFACGLWLLLASVDPECMSVLRGWGLVNATLRYQLTVPYFFLWDIAKKPYSLSICVDFTELFESRCFSRDQCCAFGPSVLVGRGAGETPPGMQGLSGPAGSPGCALSAVRLRRASDLTGLRRPQLLCPAWRPLPCRVRACRAPLACSLSQGFACRPRLSSQLPVGKQVCGKAGAHGWPVEGRDLDLGAPREVHLSRVGSWSESGCDSSV